MLDKKLEKHKKIKSEINLTQAKAMKIARDFVKENPWFANGCVYIDCPDISDLFIVKEYKIKQCTGKEWVDYFYTYISPPKE